MTNTLLSYQILLKNAIKKTNLNGALLETIYV